MSGPSYEEVLKVHGLSESQMKQLFPPKDLKIRGRVAKDLYGWQKDYLGLGPGAVSGLKHDVTMDDEGRRKEYLRQWITKHGVKATYELMARGFLDAERADLADLVCIICKENTACGESVNAIRLHADRSHYTCRCCS